MKLHLTTAENNNLITAYGEAFVEINKTRYSQNLIVLANQLILDWKIASFAELTSAHFNEIIDINPEVLLLGTGLKHQFLHPTLAQNLIEKNIPVECMTTAAACRTYNILMSEGRNVAAALIL
ncbi:MAG: Mth938-like domain-containing protein [Pseudomonadota bacterium]